MRGTGIEGESDGDNLISILRPIRVRSSKSKRDVDETDVQLCSLLSRAEGKADSMSFEVVNSEVLAQEDVT
jgi:hypothetical protein